MGLHFQLKFLNLQIGKIFGHMVILVGIVSNGSEKQNNLYCLITVIIIPERAQCILYCSYSSILFNLVLFPVQLLAANSSNTTRAEINRDKNKHKMLMIGCCSFVYMPIFFLVFSPTFFDFTEKK